MDLVRLADELRPATAPDIMQRALMLHGREAAIAFSGAEDVLLIEYAQQSGLPFRVFALDTGRLHPETYDLFERVESHYRLRIEPCFPDAAAVQRLVQGKGWFSFRQDGHQECCAIRKVAPLRAKLATLDAWITGQRRDQSATRGAVPVVQADPSFAGRGGAGMLAKWNPLANATSAVAPSSRWARASSASRTACVACAAWAAARSAAALVASTVPSGESAVRVTARSGSPAGGMAALRNSRAERPSWATCGGSSVTSSAPSLPAASARSIFSPNFCRAQSARLSAP